MASDDLELVANAVTVGVVEAIAVAVVARFSVVARSSIGSCSIEVARAVVLASDDFKLVANTIPVCVVDAVFSAIKSFCSEGASSRVGS